LIRTSGVTFDEEGSMLKKLSYTIAVGIVAAMSAAMTAVVIAGQSPGRTAWPAGYVQDRDGVLPAQRTRRVGWIA
jgi:hypothetical protein